MENNTIKISRAELCEKYKSYSDELKSLEKKSYNYKVSVPLNGMGLVRKLTFKDLIVAYGVVNEYATVKKAAMEALGMTDADFNEDDASYLGIPVTDWVDDMKERTQQLRDERRIHNLKRAIPTLKRHLSEDDVFLLDMQSIADVL